MFLHCQVSRCLGEKLFWNDVPEKFLSKLIALISDFCLSQVLLYWLFKWQFSYFIFLSALRNLVFTANVYVHAMCVPVWADGFLIYSMRYNCFLSSYLDVQVALPWLGCWDHCQAGSCVVCTHSNYSSTRSSRLVLVSAPVLKSVCSPRISYLFLKPWSDTEWIHCCLLSFVLTFSVGIGRICWWISINVNLSKHIYVLYTTSQEYNPALYPPLYYIPSH